LKIKRFTILEQHNDGMEMKIIKPVITIILAILLMLSLSGTAFADSSGYITVQFDKESAKVGETVTLTITTYNTGTITWNNVMVSAPVPNGLKYLSHYTTIDKADYSSSSGAWAIGNMRHDQNGKTKTLYITFEVLSSAEGHNVVANARFTSITIGNPPVNFENNVSRANPAVLYVSTEDTGSGTGNGSGNGTGDGNSTNNGNGPGTIPPYEDIMGKIVNQNTFLDQLNALNNSSVGEQSTGQSGAGGQTYEITPTTQLPLPNNVIYALIAAIGIIALIALGYFKGMRLN
jgi:uncharacterized repeat protein (TIGR01451 family)